MSEILLDAAAFDAAIKKVAKDIFNQNKNIADLAVVGVQNKGVLIAKRFLSELCKIAKVSQETVPFGILDITLYRDDLDDFGADMPLIKDTEIPFDISRKNIILVDDVLYTGRTARAALDVLTDFGRPKCIQLAVLVDRGHRELPIEARYAGVRKVIDGKVKVECKEVDGRDRVIIL
ncbi:MAG: bifunctional pyr operon transcriptional regulator/uracil phosphoribosyltransferase PyrR [Endomicrobium sp.]|jgi:pyrimidine operon attenuation protein/uracil phosphoribosyltransferase|nr:bifunctional pyr operon transcriptional regulator/uracil phosphoribosyltransferase PyrR [Endomicrobium sp.]